MVKQLDSNSAIISTSRYETFDVDDSTEVTVKGGKFV